MTHEKIIRFGPSGSLVGVLNLASDPSSESNSPPIVVLLNAGIVHRVGPYRLNVDIARRLAEAGYSSCRVDLSGLGDSALRTDIVDAAQLGIQDGQNLFDALKELTGADRFVLIGLCSGSYHAHQLGLADARVVGAVFIDGFTFPTAKHRWRAFRKKLSYRFLRNALKRRLLKLMPTELGDGSGSQPAELSFFEQNQNAAAVANEIRQLVDHGKQLMFVYTGGNPDFSAAQQFSEMFDFPDDVIGIQLHYLPQSDHTFPRVESRRKLVDLIAQWYQHSFPLKNEVADSTVNSSASYSVGSCNNFPTTLGNKDSQDWVSPWALPPSPLALPPSAT